MKRVWLAILLGGALITSFAWVKRDDYRVNKSTQGVYKLDLQTYASVDNPSDAREMPTDYFFRWRLDVPKKYIHSYYGRNGSPRSDPNRNGRNNFRIMLFAVMDKETMTVLPHPSLRRGYPVPNDMVIRIKNTYSTSERVIDKAEGQLCLTMEEVAKLSNSPTFKCIEGKRTCILSLPVDGWSVRVSLGREMYMEDPQKYCGVVKDFLDDLTLERDDLSVANFRVIDRSK